MYRSKRCALLRGGGVTIATYIALCALRAAPAVADEIGIIALAGVYRTDNPTRSPDIHVMDDVTSMTVGSYGNKETRKLKTSWWAQVQNEQYADEIFGDHTYGNVLWSLDADIVPRRFGWKIDENFGQVLVNINKPDTPLNRANFNTFGTGPTLRIPIGARTAFDAKAMVTDTKYELHTLDGRSSATEIGVTRGWLNRSELGFYLSSEENTFESEGLQDYGIERAFFRYAVRGASTTLVADVGVNRATLPIASDALPFFDVSLDRTLRSGSTLGVQAESKLTNVTEQFSNLSTAGSNRPIDINTFGGLYQAQLLRMRYARTSGRTQLQLGISYREERPAGATTGDVRYFHVLDGSFYRVYGPKTGIRVYGTLTNRSLAGFASSGRQDDFDTELGIEIAKPIRTETLRWVVNLQRAQRQSQDPSEEYTEYRVGITFRYSKFILAPRRGNYPGGD